MPDNRPRVTTDKVLNLAQLDAELGGHGLCGGEGVVVAAEGSPVTQKQLEDAVAAHTATFPEPLPSYDELVAEVRGIRERAAAATVTNSDAKAVRDAVAGTA